MPDLFLSEIHIDPRTRSGREALADVAAMHRSVMSGFDGDLGDSARQSAAVLFRVETDDARQRVLVQSNAPLDPARLPDGFVWTGHRDLAMPWKAGDRIRYRITINTAKKVRLDDGKRRMEAVVGDDVIGWWLPRLERAGVRSTGEPLVQPASATGRKAGGTRLTFCGHRIDGTGIVEDADRLRGSLAAGIGRGRAYGFGLLSVAALR